MITVVRRTLRSSPHRTSLDTWLAIVDLVTRGEQGQRRGELLAVSGIASSIIADRAIQKVPLVITCEGPRTRLYCLHDEEALEGSDADEAPLGFDPLQGEWRVSLPCPERDLAWVQKALQSHGERITARDLRMGFELDEPHESAGDTPLVLNVKGFLGS